MKLTVRRLLFALTLSAAIAISGCAEKKTLEKTVPETTTAAQTEETVPESEPETEAEPEDPDTPPAEGMVRSAITNQWITEELANKRPIAVMYPIDKAAQPQYGLNRVSVFYEIMEEGSMSRQMGIIEDWEDLQRIGNVRSIRDYFIYEALEWDSVIVHFGGPEIFVKDMLTRPDVDNINGVSGVMGSDYGAFYRIPAGSKSAHTAYTDGAHISAAFDKAKFSREHRSQYWDHDHWKFARESKPTELTEDKGAVSAKVLEMKGCYPITAPVMKYNESDGLYYRSIYGAPQKDASTGEQMAFTNVIIESAISGIRGGEYLFFHVLDGNKNGYYCTGGKMIHINWTKTGEYEPTHFYDDDGNEIAINTGKTMMFVARAGMDSFLADGVKFET